MVVVATEGSTIATYTTTGVTLSSSQAPSRRSRDPNLPSFVVPELSPGTEYTFTVAGIFADGQGAASSSLSVTTDTETTAAFTMQAYDMAVMPLITSVNPSSAMALGGDQVLLMLKNVEYQNQKKAQIVVKYGSYVLPSKAFNMIVDQRASPPMIKGIQIMEIKFFVNSCLASQYHMLQS